MFISIVAKMLSKTPKLTPMVWFETAPDYKEGFEIKSQNTSQSLTLVSSPSIIRGRGYIDRD